MFLTSKSPPDLSLQISPPAEPPCITNSSHLTQQNTFNHHHQDHIYDQPGLSLGLDMGAFNHHHHHHPNINTLTFRPQHHRNHHYLPQIHGHDFKRRPSRRIRAPRIRWTSTLHDHFIHAVHLLGGHQRATPKSVQELMNVKDLTLAHVKSHLQVPIIMYRTVKSTDKGAGGLVADQMQVISVSPPTTALQSQRNENGNENGNAGELE
ncbi:hypothetical protein OSB04_003067 [Centaurea solstitialis]|uniref:Transcription factor KAN4 n=1 Tax=Centaurea solstitialis TaxID=347529 RepID=A0AA38U4L7_9ASTR|nr:hypothetical protein OSB04_003067 [Centaurea solstitialis]